MSSQQAQQTKWEKVVEIISKLNIYDSETTDPILLRREILSTRLFIVLFVTSLCVISVYASASLQKKTEKILFPTENQYRYILQVYPTTLTCPCSIISIPFNEFALVSPTFHQVCESDFVSQRWIDFVFHPNRSIFWPMDIRNSLSAIWQIIRAFCTESKMTLDNSLQSFQDSSLISSIVLSPELLETELQVAVNTLQQTAIDSLMRPSKFILGLTRVRNFLTGVSTNLIALGRALLPTEFVDLVTTRTTAYKNRGADKFCFCQDDDSCPIPAGVYHSDTWETFGFYDLNEIVPNEIIPGLLLDCLPMQTVLGSTLECFYNQTCINSLMSVYPNYLNISLLAINIESRFQSIDRIEKLIESIFIEKIFSRTNFTSYFLKCKPNFCIYSYAQRFDWSYIVTTVIGLFSGLNTILQLICPYIIQWILWLKNRGKLNGTQEEARATRVSWKVMAHRWILSLFDTAVNLNLFTKKSRRPIQLRRGRIATRLYLVLFSVILIALSVYIAVSVRSVTQISRLPSEARFKYLQEQYPETLECSCSVVSTAYKNIIDIFPSLHQVCSSEFVDKSWYQKLGVIEAHEGSRNYTFSLAWYFRSIATVCDLSQLLLDQSIRRFNSTEYVSAKVPSIENFESQMKNIISGFKLTTKNEFDHNLKLIEAILHANQYIAVTMMRMWNNGSFVINYGMDGFTSHLIRVITAGGNMGFQNGVCYCAREGSCHSEDLRPYAPMFTCSLFESAMRMSLEDLYAPDFVRLFEDYIDPANTDLLRNTSTLDPTKPTRFETNTTLQEIFEELMVEDWNSQASFSRFYEICRPESCSYSYNERPSLVLLISVISGIVGGLNIVLRLICPLFVRLLIKDPHNNLTDPSMNINFNQDQFRPADYLKSIIGNVRQAITSLNLFDDKPNTINTKKKEVASTWLYLSLLISTTIAATVYISLISYSSTVIVLLSSFSEYDRLSRSGLNSFRCPCTEISVPYKDFVSIEATFHQVCDSVFVRQSWIYALFDEGWWSMYEIFDIRIRGSAYFGLLSSLCQLSKNAIANALNQYLSEIFVNIDMLTENEFHSKVNASIDLFEKNTAAQFSTVLNILNQLTHANTFTSTYMLNWEWEIPVYQTLHRLNTLPARHHVGCSCGTRSDCARNAGIFDLFTNSSIWIIPGFYIGCSSVETLLQSTLECFYDQSCVNNIVMYTRETLLKMNMSLTEIIALDSDSLSRYKPNTTIQQIVELLFVEQWQKNVSYTPFYQKCGPIQCTYSYEKRNDVLYISATILSIYGGATAILRLVVPYFISLLIHIVYHRVPTIRPSN